MSKPIGTSFKAPAITDLYFNEVVKWANLCSLELGVCDHCPVLKRCIKYWDKQACYLANYEMGKDRHITLVRYLGKIRERRNYILEGWLNEVQMRGATLVVGSR